jgi:hypothetical protein
LAEHEEYAKELAYAVEKRQRTEHVSSLVGADRERTKAYQMGNAGKPELKCSKKTQAKSLPPTHWTKLDRANTYASWWAMDETGRQETKRQHAEVKTVAVRENAAAEQ